MLDEAAHLGRGQLRHKALGWLSFVRHKLLVTRETGIRILAPIVRKVDEEKNGTTEKVSRPLGFRTVSVFAQEQTDGQPFPELNTNAAEGGETLLPLLEKAAAQLNITLVYKAIAGSAEGYSKGGLIEIEETLDTPHVAVSSPMKSATN